MAKNDTIEVEGKILVKGKRLLDGEEIEVIHLINEKTMQEVEIERPKQMGIYNRCAYH